MQKLFKPHGKSIVSADKHHSDDDDYWRQSPPPSRIRNGNRSGDVWIMAG